MNRIPLSVPEISLIAVTRGMLGAGVGLLLAGRLSNDQRRAAGWTLLAIGALTSVPIAIQLFGSEHDEPGRRTARGGHGGSSRRFARQEQPA